MYDVEIVTDLLLRVKELTQRISERFKEIHSVADLTDSPAGIEKMDLLLMPLITIGELVARIDNKTGQSLFSKYPDIPWRDIKITRNWIAHDYFNVDAREIFDTCQKNIPELEEAINKIIIDLQGQK